MNLPVYPKIDRDGMAARVRPYLRPYLALLAAFLLAISALVRANFFYIDDLGRNLEGYHIWSNFGRWVNQVLSTLVHMDWFLSDVSPYTQVLAVALLALACVIFARVMARGGRPGPWLYVASVPLAINPYFLECLAYKWDSPYMAISVLASVAPALALRSSWRSLLAASLVGSLVMCTTYQAASGIYPMVVLAASLCRWLDGEDGREALRGVGVAAAGYLIGLIVFKLFLYAPTEIYVDASVPGPLELPGVVAAHLLRYWGLVVSDFKRVWLLAIALLAVAAPISCALGCRRSGVRRPAAALALSLALVALLPVLAFGLYPALSSPLFETRAMYGVGAAIAVAAALVARERGAAALLGKLAAAALALAFLVFTLTFGNALAEQKRYTEYRAEAAIARLDGLEVMASDDEKVVALRGGIGRSPALARLVEDTPILGRLVPQTIQAGWTWGEKFFTDYFSWPNCTFDDTGTVSGMDLPLVDEAMLTNVYSDGHYVVVEFK